MIYADIKDLGRYRALSPNFMTAIDFLQNTDLHTLGQGRTDIDGDAVYVNHMSYDSMEEAQCFTEAHLKYADIQVIASGKEKIGVSHISALTVEEQNEKEDFLKCSGPVEHWMQLSFGKVLILFPEDGHKVKVAVAEPVKVEKFVVKVLL